MEFGIERIFVKKKIKIELARQNYVDQYEEQVKFILKTLGHPEALVTDETLIWDLVHMFDSGGYDKQLAKMSKKVGFSVEPNDVLWKVAKKIKALSASRQIICVTHLATIASQGDKHILVDKTVKDKKTQIYIKDLAGNDRELEISRLLGDTSSKITIKHAQELLAK